MSARELVNELMAAATFEHAAQIALGRVLAVAGGALARSRYAEDGVITRAMLHLRPAGGYSGLVVLERGGELTEGGDEDTLFPSATAWRQIEASRAAVSLDVRLGLLTPLGGQAVAAPRREGARVSRETVNRLLSRSTSHLHAVPLRGPGGRLFGMLSVEANCLEAMGEDFIWAACHDDLQLVADLASPALTGLPRAPRPVLRDDPLLPVAGARMRGLVRLLEVFAGQRETLLISGPTGAGKSRLARWCHARSGRRGSFHLVDLLTVPEDMQPGELFGWKKGAFTGAIQDRAGAVASAEGGTLFLDEIDKLSLKAQAGLLQLLETRQYRVLGDPGPPREADVRFVVGTNVDLRSAVAEGRFREDLYYRINVLPVQLPGLDERADEVPAWAAFMVSRHHAEVCGGASGGGSGEGGAALSADAAMALADQPWPGNLRQLDNVVRRAYAMALVDGEGGAGEFVVALRHVERALSFELPTGSATPSKATPSKATPTGGGLAASLRAAAAAFLDAFEADPSLGLDHAAAFPGFVLAEAAARRGDLKEVYLAFGREKAVQSRNYRRDFQRELGRVAALYQALGEPLDAEVAALLDGREPPPRG